MTYTNEDAQEEAAGLLALARQAHEAHVAQGKAKAEEILRKAQEEADRLLREANEELTWLQAKISDHRDFERQYRESIRDYLGGLLSTFDDGDTFVPSSAVSEDADETPAEDAPVEENNEAAISPLYGEPEPLFEVDSPAEAEVPAFVPEAAEAEEAPAFEPAPSFAEETTTAPLETSDAVASDEAPEVPAFDADWKADESPESVLDEALASDAKEDEVPSEFEGAINSGESFDELLSGVENTDSPIAADDSFEAPESTPAPEFENFVPGDDEGEVSEEVNKKLKGFFGMRRG